MPKLPRITSAARTLMWVAVTVFGSISNLVFSAVGEGETTGYVLLSLLGACIVPFSLIWRRTRPELVLGLTLGAGAILTIGSTTAWVALGSFLRRRRLPFSRDRRAWLALAATTAVTYLAVHRDLSAADPENSLFGLLLEPPHWSADLPWYTRPVLTGFLMAIVVGIIALTRANSRLHSASQHIERAETANVSLSDELARYEEREHIARELHDSLGNKLAAVAMLAGAIRTDPANAPEVARQAAELQRAAHEATNEMHEVVRTYRSHRPVELSLSSLTDLLETSMRRGMIINHDVHIPPSPAAPSAVKRAVYRVVQEITTNAAKHAPGEVLTLRIRGGPREGGIHVFASNPVPAPRPNPPSSGGRGIVGIAERVEQLGGWVKVTDEPLTYEVDVWVPWRTGPQSPAGDAAAVVT